MYNAAIFLKCLIIIAGLQLTFTLMELRELKNKRVIIDGVSRTLEQRKDSIGYPDGKDFHVLGAVTDSFESVKENGVVIKLSRVTG